MTGIEARRIAATPDWVSWSNTGLGTIEKADHNGANRSDVAASISSLESFCVDEAGGYVYWAQDRGGPGSNSDI